MNYRIGDKVGGYEVTGVLGAGGMGEIYEVRNVISDRAEAMKVLLSDLRSEADLAERFIREIKLQARLRHVNIAGLHTAFEADDQLVMIMELVDGRTLSELLDRSELGAGSAVDYTIQALSALDYAHSQGVVHRDIKPSNIMVTAEGAVKLMDFGIAKAMKDKSLTRTGNLIGSLHYMSPEQVRGDTDIDERTDIYSLGVVLYEMVTGRKPFDGNSEFSIMRAHLEELPVPPGDVDSSIASQLSEVILTAMAKDRAERYQTAGNFLTELRRFSESTPWQSAARQSREVEGPPASRIDPGITGYQRPATGEPARGPAPPPPPRQAGSHPARSQSVPGETTISGHIDPQITGYMRRPEPPTAPSPPQAPPPQAGDSGRRQSSGSRARLRTISGERAVPPNLPQAPPEPAVRTMIPKVAVGVGIAVAVALGFLIPGWLSNDSLDAGKVATVAEPMAAQPDPVVSEPTRAPSTQPATPPAASTRPANPPPSRPVGGSRSGGPQPSTPAPASSAPAPAKATPPPPVSKRASAAPTERPTRTPPPPTERSPAPAIPTPSREPDPPAPVSTPASAPTPARSTQPPPAAPDPDRVYTIKEPGVSPPQMTHQVQPQYTAEARTKRIQGRVVLEAEVWQDGLAHNIRVLQSVGDTGLDQNAIAALRKWRFAPGVKAGTPVKVKIAVALGFRLM